MGYVKKEKMSVTKDGRPCTFIGRYLVVKNSDHMTGIYFEYYYENHLVTSKPKWSQAIKLAKLLDEAYHEGRESARDDFCY